MAAPPVRSTLKLSIGLPLCNAQAFLLQALDCLLAQTFADFEIVICDNASTDRTKQICRDCASRAPRIRYCVTSRTWVPSPIFNRTFELSSAPLCKWAAHDDLHRSNYLESCVRLLEDDPTASGWPFRSIPPPKRTSVRRGEQRAKFLERGWQFHPMW
jgi:glycosyltransferase involved in cell wall biosynthesis